MNAAGRKEIKDLVEQLNEIESDLEEILETEQSKYDNMPESLQESEKGENMREWIEAIEAALCWFEDITGSLEGVE